MKLTLRQHLSHILLTALALTVCVPEMISPALASTSSASNSIYVSSSAKSQVTFKVDLNDKFRLQTAVLRVSRIVRNKPSFVALGSAKLNTKAVGGLTKKLTIIKNDIFQVLVANKIIAQAKLPTSLKSTLTLLKLYVVTTPSIALPFVSPTPTPTSEPTPSPTATPEPTPAVAPEPTPTVAPEPTPTPTATPTPSTTPVAPSGGGSTPPPPPPPSSPLPSIINIAALTGLTAPVAGATPVSSITPTDQYTGTVSWLGSPSTFGYGEIDTATVTLTAKSGFTLAGVASNFFRAAGATSNSNSANSGLITVVFPRTTNLSTIDIASILGVMPPVAGETPRSTVVSTAEYTGTIAWSGSPSTFGYSTSYTATITLTPKSGYTLSGIASNFFTVDAATATNSANSGVITAVFAATADLAPVTRATISGVTQPVAGATPVNSITASLQYTGTVTWSGTPSTFENYTIYTATITLTAKPGSTFTGVGSNFFVVQGAMSQTNNADSGVITAEFPRTSLATPFLDSASGGASANSLKVSFNADANAASYVARVYADNQKSVLKASFANYVSGQDLSDAQIIGGTTYWIGLTAIGTSAELDSAESALLSAVASSSAAITLSTPVVSAVPGSPSGSIRVTFASVPHALSYDLKIYADNSGSLGAIVDTIHSYSSGTDISGLAPGTRYFVTVTAIAGSPSYLDSAESIAASAVAHVGS